MTLANVPEGYVRSATARYEVVAQAAAHDAFVAILTGGITLHERAAADPHGRMMMGRLPAYAVALPGVERPVVVRHNHHGGAFASLTGDVFLAPTGAPRELERSLGLQRKLVRTPTIVGYATYVAGPWLWRADVVTEEVAHAEDLAGYLEREPSERAAALEAAAELIASLERAGAVHADLNARNILLASSPAGLVPWALDVDRVHFVEGREAVTRRNVTRLARSLRKWRDRWGAAITEGEIAAFERRFSR